MKPKNSKNAEGTKPHISIATSAWMPQQVNAEVGQLVRCVHIALAATIAA